MSFLNSCPPQPVNEPIMDYAPGSKESLSLKQELDRQKAGSVEVPLIIGGKEIRTGRTKEIRSPHDHKRVLGIFHLADKDTAKGAIDAALAAKEKWENTPWEQRCAIFLKAADLLAGKYRYVINAATMLGQSKNVFQAELDAACESVDYLRFNVQYTHMIYTQQPAIHAGGNWNRLEYRPLEGFVFAVTPFNFTAIGVNLPTAPALMGNVVIWKPSSTAILSNYYFMRILQEAGLPDGVINFIPGSGAEIGDPVFDHRDFAGLHFTGSTATFNSIWNRIAGNLNRGVYKTYPRLVGETGGKNFVVAHKDADADELSVALFRGAFEYQGQKCSAASRAYIPKSLWPEVKSRLHRMAGEITVGDVSALSTFMGAVIDKASFKNIVSYIDYAAKSADAEIVVGGKYNDSDGYFIPPTVIETSDSGFKSMREEIFGPVLTVYVYEDEKFEETLKLIDETSPYALTGAVFARDRGIIDMAMKALRHAAGNFYINDKPTGAVIGQQPFGGSRMSGTNDKAGSWLNLLRWTSPRTIKENFSPPKDYRYPHMGGTSMPADALLVVSEAIKGERVV